MEEYLKGLTEKQSLTDILIHNFFGNATDFALGYYLWYLDTLSSGWNGCIRSSFERESSESGWRNPTE